VGFFRPQQLTLSEQKIPSSAAKMTSLLNRIGFAARLHGSVVSLSIRNLATSGQREFVETEKVGGKKNVGLIKLNRPKALNALCDGLMNDLSSALDDFEADSEVGALIITGNGKAFAAGADIKEMKQLEFAQVFKGSFLANWTRVTQCTKPVIAAVNGYAVSLTQFISYNVNKTEFLARWWM